MHRVLLIQCLFALAISLAIPSAHGNDWLQFGGDAQHSGRNTAETAITPSNVSALVQKYQVTLPATADGAPVFLEAVATPIGTKDLLFVTTRDGRIIALDAQNGAQVWTHQYGPGTCQINLTGGACYTTSSPAIDPNRQYVYSYGLDGNVHKYHVGDGTETIDGIWPQLTTLKGFDEKGSSALSTATSNGTTYLYVVHGGYPGDNGDYQGHVTAINLATGAQKVFNAACSDQAVHFKRLANGVPPTCSTPRNAIWSRPGVIYDAGTDRIFMGTGNGVYDGNHNWSESVIALNPDGSGGTGVDAGKALDSYTPANFQSLDNGDTDLGSTAPAILPVPANSSVQHLAVQSGKDAKLRLLNLANLSGQGGPGHLGGEVGSLTNVINVPQGGVVLTQPAVWINPADGTTWVFVVNSSGASGLQLIFDVNGNPSLSPRWQNGQGGTSPIAANNMLFSISGSTVRALDPTSGNVTWSLARSGGFHWESLIVANGVVYATDSSNRLTAYAVAGGPATTTLSSSANPSTVGTNVTFTASVTGSTPTGTVGFTDGGTTISGCGAVALTGSGNTRTAQCSTSAITAGTHFIVANYAGDAANTASASTPLSQVVNSGAPPGTLVNPSFEIPALSSGFQYNPSAPGIGWTFSANSGVQKNGSALGAAPAPNGTQTAFVQVTSSISQTLNLNAGSYTLSFQVARRGKQAQPIKVTVDGVQVGSLVSPASNSFGRFSLPFSVATSGAHTIAFTGTDPHDKTTFIDNVAVTTPGASTTTTLASSLNPSTVGTNVTFTASVTGSAPTGTVGFTDGGSTLSGCGAVALPAGSATSKTATCDSAVLTTGTHSIVATYGGDSGNAGSTSSAFSQVVNSGTPPGSLVNPSFEIPALSSGFQYNPSAPGIGWTFSANSGVQKNGSALGAAPAPNGTQTAFIQRTGTVTQTLNLNAGSYTLSFQAARRGKQAQPLRVTVDGVQVGSLVSPASNSFGSFSIPFSVATSGAHTLAFTGNNPNDKITFIDNVTVQ